MMMVHCENNFSVPCRVRVNLSKSIFEEINGYFYTGVVKEDTLYVKSKTNLHLVIASLYNNIKSAGGERRRI